jgi:hypothetical protein
MLRTHAHTPADKGVTEYGIIILCVRFPPAMKTLPYEKTLLTAEDKAVALTTHRIRADFRNGGHARVQSIMLEHVTSCEITKTSHPLLLVIGIILAIAGSVGAMTMRSDSTAGALGIVVIGALFLVIYLATRRIVLSVSSASASINLRVTSLGVEGAVAFVDELEAAKASQLIPQNA